MNRYEWLNYHFNGSIRDLCSFYKDLSGIEDLVEFCKWRRDNPEEVQTFIYGPDSQVQKVVVVVLTPKLEDEYALRARSLFYNVPIVYAYGTGPFFNEPHYFNAGIQKALERRDPDWVVLSSDDVFPIDDFQVLTQALAELDPEKVDHVWINPAPNYYHSYDAFVSRRFVGEVIYRDLRGGYHRKLNDFYEKFRVRDIILPKRPITKPFRYRFFHTIVPSSFYEKLLPLKMTSDFAVFSARYLEKNPLNDLYPTQEDIDLSLRLLRAKSAYVDFRAGSTIGGHLVPGMKKALKEVLNLALFNHAIRGGEYSNLGI